MSIEEKIIERGRRVPQEEWDRVPADLIDRLDYYTAGADIPPESPPELPDTPAGQLFGRIRDLFADVPQEEWDKWPDDLIENLYHCLYGAEKDSERPKRTVEDILLDYYRRVPPEEWVKLPPDLIERLDYYTSGAAIPPESPPERRSIEEEIAEIWKDVPQEELDKIPTDLSYRLDEYIYGDDAMFGVDP